MFPFLLFLGLLSVKPFTGVAHPGTLWTNANAQIDSKIAGSPSVYVFNVNGVAGPTPSTGTPTLTRNTACWAYGTTGMSALTVAQGGSYTPYGYAAIAPDIIIGASHTGLLAAGTTLSFVTEDGSNTLVTVTTLGAAQSVAGNLDLFVCRLASNLPAGVRPLKVPPSNFLTAYLAYYTRQVGVLQCNQFAQASVTNWTDTASVVRTTQPPNGTQRRTYYNAMVTGDSGHPSCLIVNNELVLLCCLYFSNQGLANTWDNAAAINAAIAATGSTSTLTTYNLGAFGP